ncbi:cell adhesion molecule Dscam1-like [Ornithodoros turicata]|uniref:cell adhesion molecule Dscam1-like n=1 Tax=Ornithodoros turicata TaxID=34597 RepID=UPI003139A80D
MSPPNGVVLSVRTFFVVISIGAWWKTVEAVESRIPHFVREPPQRVEFLNGTGAVVPCLAHGSPPPQVTWTTLSGQPVTDVPGLRHLRPDGSLVLPPFRAEDFKEDVHSAVYRCVASNVAGTVGSHNVRVRAVIRRRYDVKVYEEFVIKGNTAVLRCHVPEYVREFVSVTAWIVDETIKVASGYLRGDRYSVFPGGELHIRKADLADTMSRYQCQTQHRLTGEVVSSPSSRRLTVRESFAMSPRIVDSRRQVHGERGLTVELPCAAQGHPVPTYQWFRNVRGQAVPVPMGNRFVQLDGTLVIHQVSLNDAGIYTCFVNNTSGSDTVDTDLQIFSPLSVVVHPRTQKVDVGRPASLNCSVSGQPVTSVEWYRNQQPLLKGSSHSPYSVTIASVRREDRGAYQCYAYNEKESAQGAAELALADDPPYLRESFTERTLSPGPSVSLKCIASGRPLPQVTWTLDGLPVPEDSRFRMGDYVTSEGSVVSFVNISAVRPEDSGLYRCSAGNDVGKAEHAARVNIYGPPFVRQMANRSVVAGEVIDITCPVGGFPIDSIVWEREGLRLPYNHRQKAFPNGTLLVQDVERATDEGLYACAARNKDGQSAHGSLHVKVLVRPAIVPFAFPESLHEGQRFNVLCTVSKGDSPVHIAWYKDEAPVSSSGPAAVTVLNVTQFSSTLIFEKVLAEHRGNYTCEARNAAGVVRATATMVIHVPPVWRIEPSDTIVVKGGTAVIDCQADGFPVPRVRWTKSEGDVPGDYKTISSSSKVHVFENGSLAIHNAEEKDSGYFLCQASNGISPVLSKVIKLSVHVAAHFRSKFKAETVRRGHLARLKCEAFGDKPLIITWSKDKQSFDPKADPRYELNETLTSSGIVSEITIRGADRRDSALFTCLARNSFGSDDTNMQLILQEPPDSPQDVKLLEYSSRFVKLSWSPPYSGNSPILKYFVQYKEDSESWHRKSQNVTVPGSESSAEVRGLHPVTLYALRVMSLNALGHSDPSAETHVKTDEEAPGGPPLKIRAEATGSQSIKVWWKPPRKDLQFGTLKGYYVGYKVKESADTYVYKTLDVTTVSFRDECHVTNLRRNTEYSLVVQAFNAKGAGPPSEEIFVRTLENDPPTSPTVKVLSSSTSSITLTWKHNSDTTDALGYTVYYRKDFGEWLETNLPPESEKYSIDNLACGATYQLYLTAFNAVGKGGPSNILSTKTDGVAPVAPDKPSLITVNSTSISVHLDSWHDGGCVIKSFEIRYRRQREKVWNVVGHEIPPAQKVVFLSDLAPRVAYLLQVIAKNDAGVTEAEYDFVTLPAVRETETTPMVIESESAPFYLELGVILPASVSLIVVVAISVLVCVVLRKRYSSGSSNSGSSTYGTRKNHIQECLHMSEVDKSLGKKSGSLDGRLDYYPTPYATTRVAGVDERKLNDCSYRQAQEEPLYATVKRTPRPPRSDIHIYNYPIVNPVSDMGDRRASSSHWKMATAVVNLDDGPMGMEANHSPSKRLNRLSHR